MFWSKIWFFVIAVIAAFAIAIALVMPRPAERATEITQKQRLRGACGIAEILLRDNARQRVQLAGEFARADAPEDQPALRIGEILYLASKGELVSQDANATAKTALITLMKEKEGMPEFVILLDARGRVVARTGVRESDYGDLLRGYFLVDDALDGYMRDDLWQMGGKLYRVAASPVVTSRVPAEWAGAVVIGSPIDNSFATTMSNSLGVSVTFYLASDAVASSNAVQIHQAAIAHAGKLANLPPGQDCNKGEPFETSSGDKSYIAMVSRLPGEAGALGAFYTVFVEREKAVGFMGALSAVTKDDLSFSRFPWIKLALGFLLIIGVGLALMILEADRPLRRLAAETVKLAQGERERLEEERYRGKTGSIARSVNIAVDKLNREAKSARKELDQLLGPMPGQGATGVPYDAQGAGPLAMAAASPLPMAGPAVVPVEPFQPPPPSEFKFSHNPGPKIGASRPAAAAAPAPAASPAAAAPNAFQLDIGPGGRAPTPAPAAADLKAPRRPTPPPQPMAPPPVPKVKSPTNDRVLPSPLTLPTPIEPSQPGIALSIDDDPMATQIPTLIKSPGTGAVAAPSPGPNNLLDEATVVSRESARLATDDRENVYFREIFDDFVALKRQCGESTDNLTFDKFATKLRSNRDALIAKHGCRTVKFQVYVKDGKAALKASPVR